MDFTGYKSALRQEASVEAKQYKQPIQDQIKKGVCLIGWKIKCVEIDHGCDIVLSVIQRSVEAWPRLPFKINDFACISTITRENDELALGATVTARVLKIQQEHKLLKFAHSDMSDNIMKITEADEVALCLSPIDHTTHVMLEAIGCIEDDDNIVSRIVRAQKGLNIKMSKTEAWNPFDSNINLKQRAAISQALGSQFTVLHGPPGTGKTTAIIELTRQLIKQGKKVLICTASNTAADNVVKKLSKYTRPKQVLRLGNIHKIEKECLPNSVSYCFRNSTAHTNLQKRMAEVFTSNMASKWTTLRRINADRKNQESDEFKAACLKADVIVSTLHASHILRENKDLSMDTLIIDEVSQALYPQCLIPVTRGLDLQQCLISGDNKQLPPVVKSQKSCTRSLLLRTLFDVAIEAYPEDIVCFLSEQYRMSKSIMQFPSKQFYRDKLVAASCVENRSLGCLVQKIEECSGVIWLDTCGKFPESGTSNTSTSKINRGEADLLCRKIKILLSMGVQPSSIGVISPYKLQVSLITSKLKQIPHGLEIECATVDGFQGREKNIIMMSLVRSNLSCSIGFLQDQRRLNVAITRPRYHLLIIGDSRTLIKDTCFEAWFNWIRANGTVVPHNKEVYKLSSTIRKSRHTTTSSRRAPHVSDSTDELLANDLRLLKITT